MERLYNNHKMTDKASFTCLNVFIRLHAKNCVRWDLCKRRPGLTEPIATKDFIWLVGFLTATCSSVGAFNTNNR